MAQSRPSRRRSGALMAGILVVGAVFTITSVSQAPAAGDPFSFALLGDVPYGSDDAAAFPDLIDDVNNDVDVELVAHAGDIRRGSETCSRSSIEARFDTFQTFEDAFWYTPGDNEWTDCRNPTPAYDPIGRLSLLRELFFENPSRTTGSTPRSVVSQATDAGYSEYVENTLFSESCVTFGSLHQVGSENGSIPWKDETTSDRTRRKNEVSARNAATAVWVDEIFDVAEADGSSGVFVLTHARTQASDPYRAVHDRLKERAETFDGRVVVANGDEHGFVEQPEFLGVENMTRWQTPGGVGAVSAWLKVIVDCSTTDVFSQVSVDVGSTPATTTTTTTPTTTPAATTTTTPPTTTTTTTPTTTPAATTPTTTPAATTTIPVMLPTTSPSVDDSIQQPASATQRAVRR